MPNKSNLAFLENYLAVKFGLGSLAFIGPFT